ncbi:hypothetical protein [Actinoplanes sp. M2I2]|uniref:hypothetical protein n=1 Tax=Actinoplanes sp. M2I2 TaxID=1734444 RepID=UPI00202284A8|nr:hypothetical protein [Actinoplanes sp. M2I2]
MLNGSQVQAITRCLTDLDDLAPHLQNDLGPNLLAVLQETAVPGHPDPTARRLGVNPLPVPPPIWRHPEGPVAALRAAYDDIRAAGVQHQLTRVTDVRFLAWVYLYTETIDDEDGPVTVRQIDAVDIDGRAYSLSHVTGEQGRCVAVLPETAAPDFDGTLALLNTLANTMRTSG